MGTDAAALRSRHREIVSPPHVDWDEVSRHSSRSAVLRRLRREVAGPCAEPGPVIPHPKGPDVKTEQVLPVRKSARRKSDSKNESIDAIVARLPPPITDRWEWQLQAACRGLDSALFFPPDKERIRARTTRISRAKAVCARCPAIADCLDHALTAGEPFGIWGGRSEEERDADTLKVTAR